MTAARLVASLGLVLLCACAPRHALLGSHVEALAREDPSLETIRVYPTSRLVRVEGSRRQILARGTPGKIVAQTVSNGASAVWVTFDPNCDEAECAFGFVESEDGRYRLFRPPNGEGDVYLRRQATRHRMEQGHLRAPSDANEVYHLGDRSVGLELKGEPPESHG